MWHLPHQRSLQYLALARCLLVVLRALQSLHLLQPVDTSWLNHPLFRHPQLFGAVIVAWRTLRARSVYRATASSVVRLSPLLWHHLPPPLWRKCTHRASRSRTTLGLMKVKRDLFHTRDVYLPHLAIPPRRLSVFQRQRILSSSLLYSLLT